mgnify:CR=1 FL=1
MMQPRVAVVVVLALLAALSGWWLYQLQRKDTTPGLVGPPRSDYSIEQFQLVALDEQGNEAFSAEGPRLARHPFLGSLNIESPRMRFPDSDGAMWSTRADAGFVSEDGELVRLQGNVRVQGPAAGDVEPIVLESPLLNIHPAGNRIATPSAVVLRGPGSILRGRNLDADLDTRRFDLDHLTGRYDLRN